MDALVIGGRVLTLEGAERPYHELVDRMTEGAAFLNRDGVIIYANLYLAVLLDTPPSYSSSGVSRVGCAPRGVIGTGISEPAMPQNDGAASDIRPALAIRAHPGRSLPDTRTPPMRIRGNPNEADSLGAVFFR